MYPRTKVLVKNLAVVVALLLGFAGPAQVTARSPQAAKALSPQLFFPAAHRGYVDPQDPLSRTWNGVFSIQNSSLVEQANVQVVFYTANGQPITPGQLTPVGSNQLSNPFVLQAGSGRSFDLGSQNALPQGRYSVVVSSDQPLTGVGWVKTTAGGGSVASQGMYTAFAPGVGSTAYLPAVKKETNGFADYLSIQNLSGGAVSNVTVNFYNQAGNQVQQSTLPPIEAYSSAQLNLQQVQISPGFDGSVVVSSSAAVAVVNNRLGGSDGNTLFTSASWSTGATTLYAPFLGRGPQSLGATVTVQNTSANEQAAVTITHSDNSAPDQLTIPPMGSQTVNYGVATFAATISSNKPVVAVVTNHHLSGAGAGSSYDAMTERSTLYELPLHAKQYSDSGSFNSEVIVYNPGPASLELLIWSSTGQFIGNNPPIAPNSSTVLSNLNLPGGFLGSIFLSQTNPPYPKGTQPFFVIASTQGQGMSGDLLSTYGGIPVPEVAATIEKSMSSLYLKAGDPLTYTLSFSAGADGGSAVITDNLPDNFTNYTYEVSAGLVLTQTTGDDYVWDAYVPAEGGVITISGIVTGSIDTVIINRAIIATASGNASRTVGGFLDVTPPDTQITAQPANPDRNAAAEFSFTGSDSNENSATGSGIVGFECQVDGGGFAACTSPHTTAGLSDGEHTFAVRAVDGVGYVDLTPASYTWTVDTTAPAVPVLSGPANSSVITGTDVVTLTWQAVGESDLAGYSLKRAGGVQDVGNVTQIVVGPLANGVYTWTVAAYDAAGNSSAYAAIRTFTVDKRLVIDPGQTSSATLVGNTGFTSTITVPAGALGLTGQLELTYQTIPEDQLPPPPGAGDLLIGFDLDLLHNGAVQAGIVFSKPITIAIAYDSALVSDPASLQLFYLDANNQWSSDGITIVTPIGNPLIATLAHLTEFGLAEVSALRNLYLPSIVR